MRTRETLETSFERDADVLVEELNRHLVGLRRIHDLAVAYAEKHRESAAALTHLAVYVAEVHELVSVAAARLRVQLDSLFDTTIALVEGEEQGA